MVQSSSMTLNLERAVSKLSILQMVALVYAGMAVISTALAAEAPAKPNILFVICDDLNCDLGSYGHPLVQSPNVDRLAAQGVRFERAYCQYPLCGPSRASFMAGLYPDQTNIHKNAILLRKHLPDVTTMSQHFQNHGYRAIRVGKIYHYHVPRDIGKPGHDDPASWDETFNPIGRDKHEEDKIFSLRKGQFGGTMSWLAAEGTDEEQTDAIGALKAIEYLEEHAQSKEPFFLAVGFYRPHTPYVAPKKYFDMYPLDEIKIPEVPDGYLKTIPAPAVKSLTRKKQHLNLEEDVAKQAIQAYYASITFADAQLGRLLDALERLELDDNTIVVFTSDHGYHMGEHGHYLKTTLFENGDRMPLIISVPGMKQAGEVTHSPAEMVDFYPTLSDLAGLPRPEHLSGVSLAPTLANPLKQARDSALTQYENGYSIRTPRYRFTAWGENGNEGFELYDHESDPSELENLANEARHSHLVTELHHELQQRVKAANKKPPGVKQVK